MSAEDPKGEHEVGVEFINADIGEVFILTQEYRVFEVIRGHGGGGNDRVKLLGFGYSSPQHEIAHPQGVNLGLGEYIFAGLACYGSTGVESWGLVFTDIDQDWRNAEKYYLFATPSLGLPSFRRVSKE